MIKFPQSLPFSREKRPILISLSFIIFLITNRLSCSCRKLIHRLAVPRAATKDLNSQLFFLWRVLYPSSQIFWKSISVLEFTVWLRAAVNHFFDISRSHRKIFGKEGGNDSLPNKRDCMHCWPDGCGFLGAMNGNHIKVSGICRSGLHFLSNHHSNSVVTGRAWLLPLTQLLAELSITVFLKCAWSWIKFD